MSLSLLRGSGVAFAACDGVDQGGLGFFMYALLSTLLALVVDANCLRGAQPQCIISTCLFLPHVHTQVASDGPLHLVTPGDGGATGGQLQATSLQIAGGEAFVQGFSMTLMGAALLFDIV